MLGRIGKVRADHPADTLFWTSVPQAGRSSRPSDETSRLLRSIVAQMPQAVLILGESGEVLAANRAAEALFAYAPGQLVGQLSEHLLPESSHHLHGDSRRRFWTNPLSRRLGCDRALVGVRRDGTQVQIEIGVKVVADGGKRHVIVSVTDVTQRAELQARLDAATDRQLAIQKLTADVAVRFAAISPDAIDDAVVDSLRQMAEMMQLDRAILWHWAGNQPNAAFHCWNRRPQTQFPDPLQLACMPFVASKLDAGEARWFARIDEVPDPADRETFRRHELQSAVVIPIASIGGGSTVRGGLALGSSTIEAHWSPAIRERLRLVAGVISLALSRRTSQIALQNALDEITRMRDRVSAENIDLRREVRARTEPRLIVSESPTVNEALRQAEQVAPTPATVLLIGETGTGKEVFAQVIHDLSPRHQRSMVRVSCAAIPSALIESELFGRERGAYTGALSRQIGRFEAANQSTLFLDEIGELEPEVQVKLLRVLQERVIERLGSTQPVKVDVRIIAATHRDLEKAVSEGRFREDLYLSPQRVSDRGAAAA